MAVRSASAQWNGSLKDGNGVMRLSSGAYEGPYSFSSRFEDGTGTNPEELVGAAHAGCFSMALSGALGRAGHEVESIATTAKVHLEKVNDAQTVTRIDLVTEARVPGLGDDEFQTIAEGAKANCPISRLLAAAEISLEATLLS